MSKTGIYCKNIRAVDGWWEDLKLALMKHAPLLLERGEWFFENDDGVDGYVCREFPFVLYLRVHDLEGKVWSAFVDGCLSHLHTPEGALTGTFARGVDVETAVRCLASHAHQEIKSCREGLDNFEAALPPQESPQ